MEVMVVVVVSGQDEVDPEAQTWCTFPSSQLWCQGKIKIQAAQTLAQNSALWKAVYHVLRTQALELDLLGFILALAQPWLFI